MKDTLEDKDENGGAVEMGKAVGVSVWRKRWTPCEGCDGRVAITFHDVVAEPLGGLAAIEITRSRKQTDLF